MKCLLPFRYGAWMCAALLCCVGMVQAQTPAASTEVLTDDIITQVLGMDKEQLTAKAGDADASRTERVNKLRAAFSDAITAFRAGDVEKTRAKLEEARQADSSISPSAVYLARLCFATNDQNLVKVGRQFLDEAVDKEPSSPEAYMIFGNLALLEGRLADAELQFTRAAELVDSPSAPQWTKEQKNTFLKNIAGGLVSVCEQRRNWSRGLNEIQAWLSIDANDPNALFRQGRLIFLQDQKNPKDEKTVADARAKFEEAYKAAVEKLAGKDELSAVVPPELALLELQSATGNVDKAREEIKRIDSKSAEYNDPKSKKEGSRVYSTLSQWYLGQGEFDKATEYANKATAIDKESPALKQLTAVLYYYANNYEAAEREFQLMHQESPQDMFAANYLALTLIEAAKKPDGSVDAAKMNKAVQVAELSARLNQKSPVALATAAWAYFNAGRIGDAAQIFAAFEQQPNMELTPDTAYYMARVYAALPAGQFPQAFNRARELMARVIGTAGGTFKHRKEAEQFHVNWGGQLPPKATGTGTTPAPSTGTTTPPPASNGESKPATPPAGPEKKPEGNN